MRLVYGAGIALMTAGAVGGDGVEGWVIIGCAAIFTFYAALYLEGTTDG